MKLRLLHLILHENGQCLLGTKKLEIMLNLGAKIFLSLTNTFSVIVNVNPCQIWTGNTQISFFNFFQQNLVHYQYYKNAPSEQVITVKRTSPTAWANILRKFLKNNNKRALSEDDLKKKSTFISNFFSVENQWKKQYNVYLKNAKSTSVNKYYKQELLQQCTMC